LTAPVPLPRVAVAYIDGIVTGSAPRRLIFSATFQKPNGSFRVASPTPAAPRDLCDSLTRQQK